MIVQGSSLCYKPLSREICLDCLYFEVRRHKTVRLHIYRASLSAHIAYLFHSLELAPLSSQPSRNKSYSLYIIHNGNKLCRIHLVKLYSFIPPPPLHPQRLSEMLRNLQRWDSACINSTPKMRQTALKLTVHNNCLMSTRI